MSIEYTPKEKEEIWKKYCSFTAEELIEKLADVHLLLLRSRMMCMQLDEDGEHINKSLAEHIDEYLEQFLE